jgi:hypothetical protein
MSLAAVALATFIPCAVYAIVYGLGCLVLNVRPFP